MSAYMNSSQASRNANMIAAKIPGRAAGSTTRNSAPSRAAPAMRAAATTASRGVRT